MLTKIQQKMDKVFGGLPNTKTPVDWFREFLSMPQHEDHSLYWMLHTYSRSNLSKWISMCRTIDETPTHTVAERKRLIRDDDFALVLYLYGECYLMYPEKRLYMPVLVASLRSYLPNELNPGPLLLISDLVSLGIPTDQHEEIMRCLEDDQLEGIVQDKRTAFRRAMEHHAKLHGEKKNCRLKRNH